VDGGLDRVGVSPHWNRAAGQDYRWALDTNGTGQRDEGLDADVLLRGITGRCAATGDWSGDGRTKAWHLTPRAAVAVRRGWKLPFVMPRTSRDVVRLRGGRYAGDGGGGS